MPLPNHSLGYRIFVTVGPWVMSVAVGSAAAQTSTLREKPAEETRLSTAAFRAGLSKRGLTELLALHIKDYPPASETESRLMMRDIKLAEAADPTHPLDQRRGWIAEANRILEEVIDRYPEDERRFGWRFDLARSLIYEEAEPFLTSILYRGGSKADRHRLQAISSRAVETLKTLTSRITMEFEKIDRMLIVEFELLESRGYVQMLDDLEPRAGYLLLWARFYDAVPRDENDPTRIRHLNTLADALTAKAPVIRTPHESSRVQVQALLLAGMTYRRLHRYQLARDNMNRAVRIATALVDPAEVQRIHWAVTLARIERVRNDADDGRFPDALSQLDALRTAPAPQGTDAYGLRVVAALLERSIYRRAADVEEENQEIELAAQMRESAWHALAELALDAPERRDELYAAIYAMIDAKVDPAALDPFDQCALIAGLLYEANLETDHGETLLNRAIEVGNRFLTNVATSAESLVPEVLYNLGVAEYRRGDRPAAAKRFLTVARDYPGFGEAMSAAELAVQLGAEMYNAPESLPGNDEVSDLYRTALEQLTGRYPDTAAAHYWRFFLAQFLEQVGEYLPAANQYALVAPDHEHQLESRFAEMRCIALALHERSTQETRDLIEFHRLNNDFLAAQRRLVTTATSSLGETASEDHITALGRMLAEAKVLTAEVEVLSPFHRPAQTLEGLAGFEKEFPNQPSFIGRVWRVRLIAYERLGRLEEAMEAIPAYIAADPARAGPTLQRLYLALAAEADERFEKRDEVVAQRKAEMALVLANLRTGQLQRSKELFETLMQREDRRPETEQPPDHRFELGYAEVLFQIGELAAALPRFNRLATRLPPTDPVRWRALLRDLQCRTALREPASGIISVIEQQKFFYPDLGGPLFAKEFQKLQRENQRRSDGS